MTSMYLWRGRVIEDRQRNEQRHEERVATAQVWSLAVQQTRRCSSQCVLRWKRTLDDCDFLGQVPCQSYGVAEDERNKSTRPWRCVDAWTTNCQEWRKNHEPDHLAGWQFDQHEQRHQLTPDTPDWLETQKASVQTCLGLTEDDD